MMQMRSFAILCAVMACGAAEPAMAVTKAEASCGYTGITYESPMVALAYDIIGNLSTDKAKADEDFAALGAGLDKTMSACKAQYHWTDAVEEEEGYYTFGILAMWGAQNKFKAAKVDYAPIGIELDQASAADWTAIKTADVKSPIYQRLISILNKQGFTLEQNGDVFNILGNYSTIALIIRDQKIKLSIWNGN